MFRDFYRRSSSKNWKIDARQIIMIWRLTEERFWDGWRGGGGPVRWVDGEGDKGRCWEKGVEGSTGKI